MNPAGETFRRPPPGPARRVPVLACWLAAAGFAWAQGVSGEQRREEATDHFRQWLAEDVAYIITDEEAEVFQSLSSDLEKERFIEEFWRRRDPDPATQVNEFKEEHYRRIAYANDHFASGFPGWRTDRGRIYIIHGPPDEIERHPSGGAYERPIHEGGGGTATYPFEIWFYREINGLGTGIELEFVDKTWNNDYRLALRPDEKDVFLNTPGHGMTKAEQLGLATKSQRMQSRFSPGSRELYPLTHHRTKDSIFARYETIAKAGAAPKIRHPELREQVLVNVLFEPALSGTIRPSYFRLNETQVLAPLTVELRNRDFSYVTRGNEKTARIIVYGRVVGIDNRLVTEFEDDLVSTLPAHSRVSEGVTLYQKLLILDQKRPYRVDLVVKDVQTGNLGVLRHGISSPAFDASRLSAGSLLLADFVQRVPETAPPDQMFVLGDLKVRPAAGNRFPVGGSLGVYLQVYNAARDQSSLLPELSVSYSILRGEVPVLELVDESGSSIVHVSPDRLVLLRGISLQGLDSGAYRVDVVVRDRIRREEVRLSERFQVGEVSG